MVNITPKILEMERRYYAAQNARGIGLDERGHGLAYDARRGLGRDDDLAELVTRLRALDDDDMRRLRALLADGAADEPPPFEGRPNVGGSMEGERRRAEADVRSVLGASDVLACDSASELYRMALQRMGVNTRGLHPSGYRAVFDATRRKHRGGAPVQLAQDGAAARSFAERFPDAARVQIAY